jgi:carbonic anhydrase
MLRWNPRGDFPEIDESAYIDKTAVIVGRVKIGKNVFIGPGAVIRADEPKSTIIIRDNCNIQDRVIIHALENSSVDIGENTSLAHGCIVHGPCKIGRNCFVGFGSAVFNAELEDMVFVKLLAVITDVKISARRVIPNGAVVDTKQKIKSLKIKPKVLDEFAQRVVKVNLDLVTGYRG